jgi:predicted nucleic acid-binding protein
MMILVDTNVLIDVIDNDPVWADWSQQQLDLANAVGPVGVNDIVYAELSMGFPGTAELDDVITRAGVSIVAPPSEALFLAGRAFLRYRAAGGPRTGVLPDFFIGAQAAAMKAPLITRDPRRYLAYFPGIELITPSVN